VEREPDPVTVVRYLATPVDLFLELQENLDALQREVQLASLEDRGGDAALPAEVVDGMVVHRAAMVQVRTVLYEQAMAAREAGLEVVDLVAEYPDDSTEAVLAIIAAARRAETAAARGDLLTPPPGPALRHLQTWAFDEVARQLHGGEPTPYAPAQD
jgi:hypothetical protein